MNINNNKIYSTQQNKINFKAIKLNEKELLESKKLLNKYIKAPEQELESLKNKTFKFFEKHLNEEIDLKTKRYYIKEDFAQELFLEFFVLLDDVRKKVLPNEEFILKLNKIKPSKDSYKSGVLEKSINETIGDSNSKIEDFLSEDNLPVYASAKNEEENKVFVDELHMVINNEILSEREKKILAGCMNGKTSGEIAKELNLSEVTISENKKTLFLKLGNDSGDSLLIKDIAKELKSRYELAMSEQEIYNSFIKKPTPLLKRQDELFDIISKSAKLLNIEEKDFAKAVIKQPLVLYMTSEELNKNVEDIAKQFNLSKSVFVKSVLRQPQIFYQHPETLHRNIKKNVEQFNVGEAAFVKAALRQPVLFYHDPESLYKKINKSAEYFNIDIESFIKVALKFPNLFYQKPEVLYQNISRSAEKFSMSNDEFLKLALRTPALFCLKPETLYNNLQQTSEKLGVDIKKIIELAAANPTLFYTKPDTAVRKIKLLKYEKQIRNQDDLKLKYGLESVNVIYKQILGFLVKKQLNLSYFNKDLTYTLKLYPDVNYKFELPESEFNEEFMEFTRNLFKETLGKSNLEFTIKNKS